MQDPDLDELKGETVIVVFGALGDLAKKAIFPNLFVLWEKGLLPSPTQIIASDTRPDPTGEKFHQQLFAFERSETANDEKRSAFENEVCRYLPGSYNTEEGYQLLEEMIKSLFPGKKMNRVFFLAIPPSAFARTSKNLKTFNYEKERENRLVVEKPLGHDSASSIELLGALRESWTEKELYLVDHLLGEDFCFSILKLRFGNSWVTDDMLSSKHVKSITLICAEEYGAEGRGGYFDEYGLIRDLCQNHILQALTFLTMEAPSSLHGDHLRDSKVDLLKSIPPIRIDQVLLGQHIASSSDPTKKAYLDDPTVLNKSSKAETFAEFVIWIDNERWRGVPIFFQCGKAITPASLSFIYNFHPPHSPSGHLFDSLPSGGPSLLPPTSNSLKIEIHPSPSVVLTTNFLAINPSTKPVNALDEGGSERPVELGWEGVKRKPTFKVYEGIFVAVLKGDKSIFVREDELREAWRIFTPLLHWKDGPDGPKPDSYEYGSKGPAGIEEFEKRFGRFV